MPLTVARWTAPLAAGPGANGGSSKTFSNNKRWARANKGWEKEMAGMDAAEREWAVRVRVENHKLRQADGVAARVERAVTLEVAKAQHAADSRAARAHAEALRVAHATSKQDAQTERRIAWREEMAAGFPKAEAARVARRSAAAAASLGAQVAGAAPQRQSRSSLRARSLPLR